jgi:serine/threonine protein kinase
VLNGYQLGTVLGRGGFGITYRAVDLLDQSFAIKEYFPRQFAMRSDADVVVASESDHGIFVDCRRRFLTEARLLATLGHNGGTPGIVRVVTFFEANNTAYSVMEALAGETLDDLLKAEGPALSLQRVISLLHGVLTPLARVHAAGFLHRDIKPSNILICSNGQPVLIDFGSARDMGPSANTTFTQVYSGHYAPIEQMMHGDEQGPFSDIYSVGGVAYRAIGGTLVDARIRQQAALGHSPDPLIPAVVVGRGRYPDALLSAIDQALAVEAHDRPQRVEEMLDLLRVSANDDPTARLTNAAPARTPVGWDTVLAGDRNPPPLNQKRSLPIGTGQPLVGESRLRHVHKTRSFFEWSRAQGNWLKGIWHRGGRSRTAILIALALLAVSICTSVYLWINASDRAAVPLNVASPQSAPSAGSAPSPPVVTASPSVQTEASGTPPSIATRPSSAPMAGVPSSPPLAATAPPAQTEAPGTRPSIAPRPSSPPVAAATPSPPLVAPPPAPALAEETWSPEDRQNARLALALMRLITTPVTESPFNGTEKMAIARFREMASVHPLGGAAGKDLSDLPALGSRLKALLMRDAVSPRGVPSSLATTPASRYARGWEAETGPSHDMVEATYWYGWAARVGDLPAWTQLGLLLARRQSLSDADLRDAALLWWVASQGGDAVASFNLGAMYDRNGNVPRDRALAQHWYNVALSQGMKNAAEALQKLAP